MVSNPALPRGPKGAPLIGSMTTMARDPLAFQLELARDYRPIATMRMGLMTYYVLTDAQLIEELLVGKHRDCVKDLITAELQPLVGMGLLTNDGDPWRRHRKLAAPAFQPKNIAAYAETMVSCAQRTFGEFRDGEQRDFHHDVMALTLEIVGKTLLGFDTKADTEKVAAAIEDVLVYFQHRLFTLRGFLPPEVPFESNRRFKKAKRALDEVVQLIIARGREAGGEANHLLGRLMSARDEFGQGMSEAQLADEALTMLLAGHETTALSIMFTMYALACRPEVRQRLLAEVDGLGGRPVTMEDLPGMTYLDAVIKETLRLYPAAPVIGREVAVPIELAGFELPRGTQVHMSAFAMQRDARYFKDPEAFRPDRWLDGSTTDIPKFAYFPFGGGPRVCIGQHFALMEAKLLVVTALQHFCLRLQPGFQMQLQPVVTLRSRDGLPVIVQRREQPGDVVDAAQ